MSTEDCKLCGEESTPWYHINGHVCQDCHAISREKNKSHWISVKDELPILENDAGVLLSDNVLICYLRINNLYNKNNTTLYISIGYYSIFEDGTDPEWNLTEPLEMDVFPSDKPYILVTHWRPLPEPPEDDA